jgi:VWFA-related protein
MRPFCRPRSRHRRAPISPPGSASSCAGRATRNIGAICCGLLSLLLLTLVTARLPLRGQDQPAQSEHGQADKPGISVDVKVVNVLATVRDKKGELVTNFGQDDFKLEEDGHPQNITYFARQTDLPLTLGLLVDTSASQRRVLPEERGASQSFLDNLLREGQDQAFLIHFDREVELLQDLTASHEKLESALKLMQIAQPENDSNSGNGGGGSGGGYPRGGGYPGGGGPYPGGGGRRVRGGGTALYDAIFLASDEVIKNQKGRKALVVLSDGVDRGSKETLDHAIEAAQRADTVVYSIYFADEEAYNGFERPGGDFGGGPYGRRGGRFPEQRVDGKKILTQISTETGGRMFQISDKHSVDDIYRKIEEELRSQYSLGYTPNASAALGYHKLHLTVKQKDDVVEARQGYYLER